MDIPIFWVIVVAIIFVFLINKNNPQKELYRLKQWFNNQPQIYYEAEQKKLQKDIIKPYNKNSLGHYSEKDFNEHLNQKRFEYRQNELLRMHVLTVLTSDKYSIESKGSAVAAWSEYMLAKHSLTDAIEIGYAESKEMYSMGDYINETQKSLLAVMEAFDFDITKELKMASEEIARQFPIVPKKNKKI